MLLPRKTKFRKSFKGKNEGNATRGTKIDFGRFGLRSLENERITSRQIEAARRAMTRYIKRGGKVWIRIFPHTPVTQKPNEVRMGSGKGAVDHYVAKVRAGRIIFELDGVSEEVAKEAMRLAGSKLPVKTRFVTREGMGD
ncbi:MAG: 50S ribosomal protein L16 [bacterium]